MQAPLGPLHSRLLFPVYTAQAVSISGDQINPTTVTRGSRSEVSLAGQIVPAGGYPSVIRRTASFAVLPPTPKLVNVVTGVRTTPLIPRRPQRRVSSLGY